MFLICSRAPKARKGTPANPYSRCLASELTEVGVACFSLSAKTGGFTWSMPMGAADLGVSDADLDLLDAYLLVSPKPLRPSPRGLRRVQLAPERQLCQLASSTFKRPQPR